MSIEFDYPLAAEITRNVDAALAEDIGPGDLTAGLVPLDYVRLLVGVHSPYAISRGMICPIGQAQRFCGCDL